MPQTNQSRDAGSVSHLCFLSVRGEPMLAAARDDRIELRDDNDALVCTIDEGGPPTSLLALPGAEPAHDVLLAGDRDGLLCRYDPVTGARLSRLPLGKGPVRDLATFTDGSARGVAAVLENGLHVWWPDSDDVTALPGPPDRESNRMFKVCAYTHAERPHLACAYTDGYIATWDLSRPASPTAQPAHEGQIWSLIAATDDDGLPIVVSGAADARVRVWRPAQPAGAAAGPALQRVGEFVADGTVRRLGQIVNRQKTMLVTASATGAVSLWRMDGARDRPERQIHLHGSEAWALACVSTSDSVLIASGDMNGDRNIMRLSTALLTEEAVKVVFSADAPLTIWAVAHGETEAGPYIACAGVGRTVNIFDGSADARPDQSPRYELKGHSSTVRALATAGDPTCPHVISAGADHRVLDWDPHSGERRRELPMRHQGEVWALTTFQDADGHHVISGSADGSVRLLTLDDAAAEVEILATDCGEVNAVLVVAADDDTIVVVGSDRGLQALSLRDRSTRPLSLPPVSAACSARGTSRPLVVVAHRDGRVELIDPVAGATLGRFPVPAGAGQVRALETVGVAGTSYVIGGCDTGQILTWHIDLTLVADPVRAGEAGIRAMDVMQSAAAGAALITGGHDGLVRRCPLTGYSPLSSGGSVGRGVRPASILLHDQPTDRDHLSRDSLVETLYDALSSPGTQPPVVVGVHAPWGQGKSSLLRQLRGRVDPTTRRFDADSPPPASREPTHTLVAKRGTEAGRWPRLRAGRRVRTRLTRAWAWRQIQRSGNRETPLQYEMRPRQAGTNHPITVWFNPWMYERPDQIWAGLTREIIAAVTERLSAPERERLWFDLNLRRTDPGALRKRILSSYLPRTLAGMTVAGLLLLLVALAAVSMGVAAMRAPTVEKLLGPTAVVLITVLGIIAQFTTGSFKHIRGWVSAEELNTSAEPKRAWRGAADPLVSTDRGYLYMLQHDVGEVVGLATAHGPLFIFVDDLDRCGPAVVADTIEAINLFLNKAFGQCVFVVALDPATVAAHLETAFQDINQRAREDPTSFGHLRHTGWRFMEKIIDLPIRLPRVPDTALSAYLDGLLDMSRPVTAPSSDARPGRPPRRRGRAIPTRAAKAAGGPDGGGGPNPAEAAGAVRGPGPVATATSIETVEGLEALPEVRSALRQAVLNLPGRNPRQTKAFVNLWRFYMVLDHRMGLLNPNLSAIERHSIEMARLVELMVRWPYLLDPLGEHVEGTGAPHTALDRLLDACADDERWAAAAAAATLDPTDSAIQGLRKLLLRARPNDNVFRTIAHRYL
ncbi:MAG TPA: P-loop NTPase fold protein [Micromonosporaceae bacterium]|nr:P-loop NTPase fold protein [Micromonosporaceae bacterium]